MHPPCTHEVMTDKHEIAVDLDLYGVPGGVRTCSLPLRRGMLYPIELLRQITACMVTGTPLFVMSSLSFLTVGLSMTRLSQACTSRRPSPSDLCPIPNHEAVHFALQLFAIIAICNQSSPKTYCN